VPGFVQSQNPEAPFFDYRSQVPGAVHRIMPADLPPPFTPPVNPRFEQKPPSPWPQAPSGFVVERYASGFETPRTIRTAPNGDLFVTELGTGRIRVLRATPDAAEPRIETFATGVDGAYGIAFYPPGPEPAFVYVGIYNSVVRFPYVNGDLRARGPQQMVVPQILSRNAGGHWTRDIAFSPDGRTMYIAVGSAANIDDTDNNPDEFHRANILETRPEGGELLVFASGIRNPSGMAIDPESGDLWVSCNERDLLGNNLPPDYVTRVLRSGFYGWPWFYTGGNQDPRHRGKHPELQHQVLVPDVLLQPHSAPLGLAIYDGDQFPPEYRSNIFTAVHGSWNRSVPVGYEVIRIRRDRGRGIGEYEDFLTGFISESGEVRGRPVGVSVAGDGSLMVTDDFANVIWRVRAVGQPAPPP